MAAGLVAETDQTEQVVEEEVDGWCNAVGAVAVAALAAETDEGVEDAAAVADVVAAAPAAVVAANGVEGGGAAIGKGSEVVADDGHHAAVGRMADEI